MVYDFASLSRLLGRMAIAAAAGHAAATSLADPATKDAAAAAIAQRKEYRQFVGKTHTFCGEVVTFGGYRGKQKRSCAIELNLGTPYWDPSVRIIIPADVRNLFGTAPEDALLLQRVCVTGKVEQEAKHIQIVITDPAQIEIAQHRAVEPFGGGAQRLCGDDTTDPQLTREVKPRYTRAAVAERIEGLVYLEAVVTTEGGVGDVRVVYGLHAELDAEAVKTIRQWRFQPGLRGKTPVAAIVQIEMAFKLRG